MQIRPRISSFSHSRNQLISKCLFGAFLMENTVLKSGKDNICHLESGKTILKYDFEKPRADLFWSNGANGLGHLECLKPKNYSYRSTFGWTCVFCDWTHLGHSIKHKCPKYKLCYPCKRIEITPGWNVLIYKQTKHLFCNR